MTEVDEIDADLRGPVNCWLNNRQQTRYARLLAIARQAEVLAERLRSNRENFENMLGSSDPRIKVHDRPPTLP